MFAAEFLPSLKERNVKKTKKSMLRAGLCDVWSFWATSIHPTSRLKDAECCVAPLAPLIHGYADLSVQWGSGLYIILSNVSACFLEGLIHEITFVWFFFSITNMQRQEGCCFYFCGQLIPSTGSQCLRWTSECRGKSYPVSLCLFMRKGKRKKKHERW